MKAVLVSIYTYSFESTSPPLYTRILRLIQWKPELTLLGAPKIHYGAASIGIGLFEK